MSNTKQRIISALVMAILVVVSVVIGKMPTLILVMLVGILCIDELLVNFAELTRKSFYYKYIITFFTLFFLAINIFFDANLSRGFFTMAALFLNIFLIYYLFKIPLQDSFMKKSTEKYPGLLSVIVILPLLSFGIHFATDHWRQYLGLLLIVTISMDTGAWFFGKNFGRVKLYPEVSPKKTVEGFVGGIFTAALLGSLTWHYLFNDYQWYYSVIFAACGAISQLGDLVQSKIKREFGIKDSSNLIPGHGGIYDRIDSLIFLSPFFVFVVKYLGRHLPL
ncbi:MAG: phosphatidate cytidylyltransferase [Bacteriovorax sp.]|nr:phosphatidate cytidylyltransferase [Bacteriovorax sp.]